MAAMNVSQKLQIIQRLSKLTQTALARELKVSFPTLNSWINERSRPHAGKVELINKLYSKLTGQKNIPEDSTNAKKDIIIQKGKKYKSIINEIANRQDIHDQFVLSFTYHTNSIEGSTLTENETAAILFQNITLKNKGLIEHLEAKNHQSALEYLFSKVGRNYEVTEDFILELHHILMNSIRPDAGSYRRHGVRIVGANVPTANYLKVPDLMGKLITEINESSNDLFFHVSQIHAKFEKIHPFSDGNGRVGRLIMTAMLLRKNFPPAVIKKQQKRLYYKYLQQAQQKEDYTSLEDFICDSILNGFDILDV